MADVKTLRSVIAWHRRQADKMMREYNPRRITAGIHRRAANHFSEVLRSKRRK